MKFAKHSVSALVLALAGAFSVAAQASADNMVVAVQQLPPTVEPQGVNNNANDDD